MKNEEMKDESVIRSLGHWDRGNESQSDEKAR